MQFGEGAMIKRMQYVSLPKYCLNLSILKGYLI